MRRSDREITDINEIYTMLERCTTINLGMYAEDYPYVIPMTFGCALENGRITVYFHCAGEGRKWDLLHRDARVCVEAHVYERIAQTGGGITAMYDSVIGFGEARLVEGRENKVNAIKIMLAHYDSSGFPVTSCKGLPHVEVYRIELETVTGKRSK